MSRIELNVVANGNFRNLETALTRLRSQVNALNASFMAGRGSELAMSQINGYVQGFEKAIDASGMFERHMVSVTSETNKFGRSLQSGNLRMNQLFRAAVDYRRGELGQIRQLAREQVRLQNATVLRMPDGRSQVIVPRGIDEAIDKQRILNQEYRIFRQVVANGSTEIINWGKNTQWAGRQLTVGLTVPLTIFGATAGKMFMDADKQLTRLAKVYGDATKGMVDQKELENIGQQTLALGQELAATMGIAASETLGIAADLAATGKEGNELIDSTREAMRLSVLGEVDRQEAMRATLSIQSVFKKDTQGLAESINFLNAVENQTSTSLNDLVEGIVKAGPVVQGLGGDIEDLSLMMVAMREGGIPASEAANAIKSSLASLINPTRQTRDVLQGFGIDLVEIVDKNAGNVIGTLVDLQSELSGLNDLSRQRAIEQIFGKFQFSRINAMLSNIGKAGSQTEQVMAIAGMSTTELAKTAEQELTSMTESVSGKFGRALESLKANLIPIGEVFVQVGTMLMNVGNKILEVFNSLPDPVKNLINGLGLITALAGPLIMITGVLGNFFGYIVKGISSFMALKRAGRGMFEAFTPESVAATNATEMLTESMFDQKIAISEMSVAVETLVKKLQELVNQLNHARTASGGLNDAAQGVLANAEAAAVVRTGPATTYTTPMIPWTKESGRQRYTGRESVGVTYSHLTPESMLGGRGVMGVGTFVDQAASDVQKDLKNFYADIVGLREQVLTPEIRRQALEDLSRAHHGTGPALESSLAQIRALSDEQLAQLLPSWEKIAAQSSEYFAILSVSAEKIEAGNKEVAAAFKKYGLDIESGRDPLASLDELRSAVNGAEGAVDKKVLEITQEFNKIEQELASMPAGPQRATRTAELIKQRVIDPYEIESVDVLKGAGVKGMGEGGLRNPLVQAIQMYTDQLFNDAESGREVAAALASGNQELIESTLRLAEARRREALAVEEKSAAEEQYQLAAKQESDARTAYAKAQRESAQALLRYGPNSPQYKAANQAEYQAQQRVIQTENELIAASERKKTAIINNVKTSNELSEEELQLAALRERQSQEVIENTVSTQRNTDETNQGTVARDGQTGAIVGNAGANSKDSKGLLRGGKIGGVLSLASMAAMFLPRPDQDTGAGQAFNAGLNIANMAGMGAMFGGPGVAIGAAAGAAIEGFNLFQRKSEETAAELEKLKTVSGALKSGLTELERSFFEVDPLKDLGDTALNSFRLKTEQATDRLIEFARAVKEAEEGTTEAGRRDAIAGFGTAEEFINSPMFAKMVSEALLGGMNIEDIKIMMGGYLDAADKEVFTPLINAELERIGKLGNKPEDIGAKYLAQLESIANRVIEGAGYTPDQGRRLRLVQDQYESARNGQEILVTNPETGEQQQGNLADTTKYLQSLAEEFGVTLEDLMAYILDSSKMPREGLSDEYQSGLVSAAGAAALGIQIGGESAYKNEDVYRDIVLAAQELVRISPDLNNISQVMGAIGNETQLFADGIENALGSGGGVFDEFLRSLGHTADSMNENTELVSEMSSRIGQISPSAKTAFDVMISNGVELQDALRIVSMLISDAGTDWAQLADLAISNPINFRNIIWTEYVSGGAAPPPGSVPAQGAAAPEGIGSRLAGTIDYSSGGGGGGGSSDTSAIDAQIEAQDKLIEKIKEEREERQKLLNLEKEAFDFAMREQDLKNQIAQARAEGRMADAALLQSQLDGERKAERQKESERQRQEQEDRRIKKAEEEKERLQEQKESMSGGGGGGGGASGSSASKQQWAANRIEILSSGVVNWTEGAELRARTGEMGPWSAFFESDKVKSYREELLKLGVPIEDINRELNDMFDSWIDNNSALFAQTDDYKFIEDSLKSMGIEGENLAEVMPDVFGALLDKQLNPKEKIDVIASALYDLGYETDEAYRKAKKLYKQYGEDFDSKGIDDELQRWLELNNRIRSAKRQLKLYQEGRGGPVSADQVERTAQLAAGQIPGVPDPNTLNAGGVQIDTEKTGIDMVDGVVQGWESGKENAAATIQAIAKYLQDEFKDANEIESPSKVYQRFGEAIIEGLINGLILPPESGNEIISSMTDTFKSVIDSYSILFTDPINGISGTMGSEVQTASDNFYNTMTQRMQDTVDEINRIMKDTLTGYTFDIVGVPKIYVKDGDSYDIWNKIIPNFASFQTTPSMPIQRAMGGYVSGPGGPTDDKIPAMLSDGEYVIKASSVSQYGTELLDRINTGKFADGGLVRLNPNNMSILGEKMAQWMTQYDGVPYSSGAAWADGPENGWGCATAARWLYDRFAGINIGNDSLSAAQYASGVGRQVSDTLPGDQQFFYYKNGVNVGNPINHTGIAQSASTMYHASGGSHGSYTNAAIDIAARNLAASRAGGTAQKRYLPETIGGMGLPIGYLKNGGMVFGNGGPTEDNILAMVSNGEFVMNAFAVKKYGKDFMDAVNNGTLAEAAAGGLMSKYPSYVANMSNGGMIRGYAKGGSVDSNSNVEYNINVNVAGTNASADEIANQVLKVMKQRDYMNRSVTRI